MRLPVLVAIAASLVVTLTKAEKDPRQSQIYSSSLDSHNSHSNQQQHSVYKSPSIVSLSSSAASASAGGGYGSAGSSSSAELSGSGQEGSRNHLTSGSGGYDSSAKNFGGGQSAFSSTGSGSSVEFGGAAEGTGSLHSIFSGSTLGGGGYPSSSSGGYPASSSGGYPASPSVSGYPASSSVSGGYPASTSTHTHPPNEQHTQVQGQAHGPAYTYYYQHYPTGNIQGGGGGGWSGDEGGSGIFGGLGDFGGGGSGGFAGLGGLGGLGGLAVLKAAAKGILAIKPFLILGLLFLIAIPVLLLFLPLPVITITGATGVNSAAPAPDGNRRTGRSSPVVSYLTNLSEKVLTAEECLERLMCKIPPPPENYQKKVKSLWDQYGSEFVKNPRLSKGLNAYFENSSSKNRNFKCNQQFRCSNKFI